MAKEYSVKLTNPRLEFLEPVFKLKLLEVRNFKNLKNVKINFRDFNVLVGQNSVGKSNILDVFRFLSDVISPGLINPYPFIRYGGYTKLVWRGMEELPIIISLTWDNGKQGSAKNKVNYTISLSGYGGSFKIISETVEFKDIRINRDSTELVIYEGKKMMRVNLDEFGLAENFSSILNNPIFGLLRHEVRKKRNGIKYSKERISEKKLWECYRAVKIIKRQIEKIQVYNLLPKSMKQPVKVDRINNLDYEGEKLQTFLFEIFSKRNSWHPDLIEPLRLLFPQLENIFPAPTEDGRIILKVKENNLELNPEALSDGFIKILAILAICSETKNSVILIDEIENSIYPEAIEILIDSLKESGNTIVITTHSPIVLNMVGLEDIQLMSLDAGETKIKKVKNAKKLKKELFDKGISLGDGWLYKILE